MAEVKPSHIKQEDTPAEQPDQQAADHAEQPEAEQGDHMEGIENEQYEQQYEQEEYPQQYEGDVQMYEEQTAEYAQDGSLAYAADVAADAAEAVASVIAGDAQGEYDGQQDYEHGHSQAGGEQYEQEYVDENGHPYAEQEVDEQTLAAHPATSRDMQASMVDAESQHGMSSEVSQAMNRYDFSSNPDGLQTLAATSSAVTQHAMHTPTKVHMHTVRSPSYSDQKQMMPKFNRARNWSVEETKILLAELERIVTSNPDERRENVLRSHSTFEEIADVLRDKGYANRDGQGCMIRWRNLLRVYKQTRANIAEGKSPGHHPNLQYAPAIESIYRFPPDGMHFSVSEASPGIESTPGNARTWSQANGYETPARKRAREISAISEHLEHVDAKIDQSIEYLSQHSDLLRLLEERLARAEDALKQSEATIADLHNIISEKDAKREELQNQLMVTVQALSQVIATKKGEDQLSPQPQQLSQ